MLNMVMFFGNIPIICILVSYMQQYNFRNLNELDTEWITDILRINGVLDNSSVKRLSLENISGYRGFTNSLFKLNLHYDVIESGSPTSIIVKTPSKIDLVRGVTNLLQSNQQEVNFYKNVPSVEKLKTPHVYFGSIDEDNQDTIILMQDMIGYTQGDSVLGCSVEDAEKYIGNIAIFHSTFWGSEQYHYIPLRSQQTQIYLDLYPRAWYSLSGKAKDFMPRHLKVLGKVILEYIPKIKEVLSLYPTTICHGDYRLDNIFFNNNELVVFDWEYCVRGRGVYDVATFISETFNPFERKQCEIDLLKLYHSTLLEKGISGYSFDDCFYDYRISMLEILVFWVVAGGYCDYNDERATAYLRNSLIRFDAAIADLDSLRVLRDI